jgi:hypothetical protein
VAGRPAEGQVHGVQHLMAQQVLARTQGTAVRDRCHDPGKVAPLPGVGDLARLDVVSRGERERYTVFRGALNRRQHVEV